MIQKYYYPKMKFQESLGQRVQLMKGVHNIIVFEKNFI